MSSFRGMYDGWGLLIAILTMAWLAFFDMFYLLEVFLIGKFSSRLLFSAVLINSLGIIIMVLPILAEKIDKKDTKFKEFLQLPKEDDKVTFPVVSAFLGEQALGAFLGTALIYTTAKSIENLGAILNEHLGAAISALYCLVLFVLSIILVTFSLIRFVTYYVHRGARSYAVAAIASSLIMLGFYNIGLNLAP